MKTSTSFFTDQIKSLPRRPRLAVTLGDPAGIGPEVVLKALASEVWDNCEITVIGSAALVDASYNQLRQVLENHEVASPDRFSLLDVGLDSDLVGQITPGLGNAASGEASFAYLQKAIACTLNGEFDGIVTAPIAKSLWKAAGHNYPGQTEVLAQACGVEKFGMLFVAQSPHSGWLLRTLLATTHIPLRQVPDALTPELMTAKLDLLVECLHSDFGLETPRIAISGLNPHSGEQGQLGHEEQDWLIPWLEAARLKHPGVKLTGPVSPDTLWVKPAQAWYGSSSKVDAHDAYLALYHDQGLIPVKLMAFDRAINTTIGLPFVRTSPDHGTAFDLAGRGIADANSMKAAIQLGAQLVHQRMTENR
jgi:4-hydroxythreonine-4-phosphate dehydrogenase